MIEVAEKQPVAIKKDNTKKNYSAILEHPSKDKQLKVSWVNITPAIAEKLLESNFSQNRDIKYKVVDSYAEQMNLGLWKESSAESIKISSNGKLIDGQHRLSAIVKANMTVAMLIVENVPEDAISAIDDGSKRTLSDSILISGLENKKFNQKIIASTITNLEVLQRSFVQNRKIQSIRKNRNISVTGTLEFSKRLTNLYDIAEEFMVNYNTKVIKKFIPIGASSLPIYYIFSQVDKEFTDMFFKTIETGIPHDDMGVNSPSFIVYNAILGYKLRGVPLSLADYFEMFTWAMNKTKLGAKVKSVYRKKDFLITDKYINSDKVALLLRSL